MKLVFFMYLEDDEAHVLKLLDEHDVVVYSHLPIEGHGPGMTGWYGEVVPYSSRLTFTILPAEKARAIRDAVAPSRGEAGFPGDGDYAIQPIEPIREGE